jgi:uncharacterized integral membrane protein
VSDWNDGKGGDKENRQVSVGLIVGAIGGVVLLLFILQNTDDADINFLLWDIGMPLWMLLVITIVLTVLVTVIVMWFLGRRDRRR